MILSNTNDNLLHVQSCECECKAGKSGKCSHTIALLYCLASYKKLGYKAVPPTQSKTSLPQQWHIPSRDMGITPASVHSVTVSRVKKTKKGPPPKKTRVTEGIVPTLYCPIQPQIPVQTLRESFIDKLSSLDYEPQFLWMLKGADTQEPDVHLDTFGTVPAKSVLACQNPVNLDEKDFVFDHTAPPHPCLFSAQQKCNYSCALARPEQDVWTAMQFELDVCIDIEEKTRMQSKTPLWKSARRNRLTASNFHRVVVRRANHETLAADLLKHKGIQTKQMKDGLEREPAAAKMYAELTGRNVLRTGFVINVNAPHLGASPDRKVYDGSADPPFGLLEIKCPSYDSYAQCPYLKKMPGGYNLKPGTPYYHQVMGQMAVTGLSWCDFLVVCRNDFHLERIKFDSQKWTSMKEKLDEFFFSCFLSAIASRS